MFWLKKMIAFDIGLGTQDILVGKEPQENTTKLVLPSPIQLLKREVLEAKDDLFFSGYTMGGGPLSHAIINHAKKNDVVMVEEAARTISDNLEEVKEKGIRVVDKRDKIDLDCFREIKLTDLFVFPKIMDLLNISCDNLPEIVGIAVQDHGIAPKGVSDRKFRFRFFKKAIEEGNGFNSLIYTNKTQRFSRFDSCLDFLEKNGLKGFVVDSKIASVLGCIDKQNKIIIDAGNGHFLAASCKGNDLVGLFEHHTSQLTEKKIRFFLDKLISGELKNEEVFDDGGHGAFVKEGIVPEEIVVTGPKRKIMPIDYDFKFAHPIGDVMMTGAVGLFKAYDLINGGEIN